MLRILMPAPQAVSGPMPRLAGLLAQGLRAHGCDVTIVPWGGGAGRGRFARVAGRLGQVLRVRRVSASLCPDVILVQTSHDWVCVLRDLALCLAVARADRKVVLQFHGSRADALTAPGGRAFKLATRLLLRRVDCVFVLSTEEQRALAAFEPHGRFHVVANPFLPVAGAGVRAPRNGGGPSAPVVLFASRLLPQKGVLDTVNAFGLLRERVPARLVVAGDGPAAADVRRLVSERGLAADVTLAGHLAPERLAETFREAAVFVLPTYHPEGFPTAISEAMSAGLPVVTSKLRGSADHLVEGTNALFVPPRDVEAIADAIERLLTDPVLRKRMASANRAKVKQFEPERVARAYVDSLADLVHLSVEAPARERLALAAREAFDLASRLDWASHDPYDLLLSPLGRAVQARSWFGARLVVQAGRRSGKRVRRVLHVPEHAEPKTLADFLRAGVLLSDAGETWASAYAPELAARLRTSSTAAHAGRGWGLAFPYASRFVSVDSGVPNLYTTTAACQALLDYHELTQDAAALETVLEGCRFLVDGLGTFEHNGHTWLRYWRGLDSPTVNVQASAASLLARAGALAGDGRLLARADDAARAALGTQRRDGSWPYSDDGRADFVDGFHTGFTLQGLAEYGSRRGAHAVAGTADAVERGFAYFADHLLTPEGLPRGLADGKASLEGQNVAQCIQTLVVCGRGPADSAAALRLWQRCVEPVLSGRRHGFPALRWSIAPAVLATAYLASSPSSSA